MNMQDFFSREEIEQVMQTRQSIKDFSTNLANHVQNLLDYLIQIKKEKVFKENYTQIIRNPIFLQFKQTMGSTRGTTLVPVKVTELFMQTFEKMNESFD